MGDSLRSRFERRAATGLAPVELTIDGQHSLLPTKRRRWVSPAERRL